MSSDPISIFAIIRALLLSVLAFAFAMMWTPLLTNILYRFKIGKPTRSTGETPIYTQLHAHKAGTPTMGGLLIWVTTAIIIGLFWLLAKIWPEQFSYLNFLSRSQTWLPLAAFLAAAVVGLIDDILNVWGWGAKSGGLRIRHRLLLYSVVAAVGAWWFTAKLGWDSIHIPLLGDLYLGWLYAAVFFVVIVATSHAVNLADGLDGLVGGIMFIALAVYAGISMVQGNYDLAALLSVVIGALLAFLWFNIYPARFFMGDTGAMSLGVLLGIMAMLTNTALLLPLIGFIFVIEATSSLLQMFYKKFFKKKFFLSTPFHHHLEAMGWPEPKIVMRFWVISGIMTTLAMALFFIDRALL
jgi:phospho-N-acetylmuramoyl-pentapeptide-transferase